jgi:hypothetical protein
MSRRSFFLAVGILGILVCGTAAVLFSLVRHEPSHYARTTVPPGAQRERLSDEFFQEFCAFLSTVARERKWYVSFTEQQVNSYFEEDFVKSGLDKRLLPEGISRPRIAFDADKIRLAFRYGCGLWSSIISIDFRVRVTKERNVVALELIGFHAGALPISAQSLLERVSEVGRQNGVEVAWYRDNGHPVALLRFQAEQPRTTLELEAIELKAGSITVLGNSTDPFAPVRTTMQAPGAPPPGPSE